MNLLNAILIGLIIMWHDETSFGIQSELGFLFEKLIPIIKANKFYTSLLIFFLIFYSAIPGIQIPTLEWRRTYVSSLMEQRAFENNLLFFPNRSWINIHDASPALLKGIIAMEDGKFFLHKGIDWIELKKSLQANQRKRKIARGGSTITMQLSKNLFYRTDKNIYRKGKELLTAIRMEKELSKKAILEHYINIVEWGDGVFGAESAAKKYFNKNADGLSVVEASRLAAVIPSPLNFTPNGKSNYVSRRSAIIRARLNDITLFPENEKKISSRANRKR